MRAGGATATFTQQVNASAGRIDIAIVRTAIRQVWPARAPRGDHLRRGRRGSGRTVDHRISNGARRRADSAAAGAGAAGECALDAESGLYLHRAAGGHHHPADSRVGRHAAGAGDLSAAARSELRRDLREIRRRSTSSRIRWTRA
jgi:hypothetical protein